MMQPPTDNLYKFLAIFGLVIAITGAVGAYQALAELRAHLIESSYQGAKALQAQALAISNRLSLLTALEAAAKKGDKAKFKELERKWKFDQGEQVANTELKKLQELRDLFAERSRMLSALGLLGVLFGAALSVIGFYFWYVRVQIHLDAKLKQGQATDPSAA